MRVFSFSLSLCLSSLFFFFFFPSWLEGRKASSEVRNATKYRIREFASSFSSSRMRGEFDEAKRMVKDNRASGNAKRGMSYSLSLSLSLFFLSLSFFPSSFQLSSCISFSHRVFPSPVQFSPRDVKVFTRFSSRPFFPKLTGKPFFFLFLSFFLPSFLARASFRI